MPKTTIVVPHQLPPEEALRRVKALLADVQQEHGGQLSDVHQEWNGNEGRLSWKSMGKGMTANLSVKPSEVEVVANLPIAFTMFKGKLEGLVRDQLSRALSPTAGATETA
jgi:Putative polyhydroxyalkanoic acid system protein (PHA_gran_rgn)